MKKGLLIAEKPSLMRTIQDVYNKHKGEFDFELTFIAQRGHLMSLKTPDELDLSLKQWKWEDLPIHPENLGGWQYKIPNETRVGNNPTSKERFDAIKKELKSGNYDFLIHSGDPDREGQLLVDEVLKALKVDIPVKRYWSNDATEEAVLHALHNLRDNDNEPFLVHLTDASYCRQHSDYRFGMNLSEAGSLRMGGRCSVGRVKTPILAIVCQREVEIENFTPSTSYGVKAKYVEGFDGQYYVAPTSSEKDDEEDNETDSGLIYFETKEEADKFITSLSSPVTVIDYQSKRVTSNAPKLFKLATCQIAGGKYGFSPDKTLKIIQSLYEKTYLSYPRTDCECISSHEDLSAMIKAAKSVPSLALFAEKITQEDIDKVLKTKKYVNDKELEKHGHSALVPTKTVPNFSSLSDDEQKIYELICRQFLAIFLPPLIQNKVTLLAETNENIFKSNGKTLIDKGYTEIFDSSFTDVEIPIHNKGDKIDVSSFDVVEKTTTCPRRFTATDLVGVCENPKKYLTDERLKSVTKELHIGTSATRAAIIKQLEERDHYLEVKKDGRKEYLIPTENGRKIWENLKDCQICRVDMTAEWEEMLEQVNSGEITKEELEKQMMSVVEQLIDDIKNAKMQTLSQNSKFPVVGKCPKCGGDICSGEKGFFCSNYKAGCKMGGFKIICGAKISDKEMTKLLNHDVIEKTLKKEDKEWKQKLRYNFDECKIDFVKAEAKTSAFTCPKCGKPMTETEKGLFCTDKNNCNFVFWKNISGHELTTSEIQTLLSGEQTEPIKMRSKKTSKMFSCPLRYNKVENKIEFVFN